MVLGNVMRDEAAEGRRKIMGKDQREADRLEKKKADWPDRERGHGTYVPFVATSVPCLK